VQAFSYLFGDLVNFEMACAGAVPQWTLRAAAGVEHAAGHAAATGLRGNLVRRTEAAAAGRTHGFHHDAADGTAAVSGPWTRSRRLADDGGRGPG